MSSILQRHDTALVSDYGKGVCTEPIVTKIITLCRDAGIPVLADPARGADYELYGHATLIKPNRLEAELAIGHPIRSPEQSIEAATVLRQRILSGPICAGARRIENLVAPGEWRREMHILGPF